MPNNIPTHGTISWGRRLTPAAIALGLALMLVLGFEQTAGAQSSFAQSASAAGPPLMFSNNFLVTGDYVVGGAYGMNVGFTTISGLPYTTGTINIPDADPATKKANPGITGTTRVPAGAQIVAALLYWETVEKVGVMPGGPGSGQKGFFGPIVNGVTQTYPITGAVLSNHAAVSFSNGGCSGTSTGKIVRAYRADVRGLLPQDANGNVLANGQYRVV